MTQKHFRKAKKLIGELLTKLVPLPLGLAVETSARRTGPDRCPLRSRALVTKNRGVSPVFNTLFSTSQIIYLNR